MTDITDPIARVAGLACWSGAVVCASELMIPFVPCV